MPDADTDPAAHRVQVEALRRMGGEARLLLALDMCDEARAISEAGRGVHWSGPMSAAEKKDRVRFYYGIELAPSGRARR